MRPVDTVHYIRPFLKGPENAPILMRKRVNAVIR